MNRILCVDDAPDMLKLLVRLLEMRGYEVAQAGNGLEAIKKAESWQPNLIITDIIMPYMNGLDAIVALKQNSCTAHIPIIVFTASIDDEDRQKALELGADEHMPKPFDSSTLDKLLQRFLGPNASMQNFEQTRQDEIRDAASKVLLAQKMSLAYQLDLHRANPELAAALTYYTALSRGVLHGLRNRLGILQSYLPQAQYALKLLDGLTMLHLKPSLAREFFDGSIVDIPVDTLTAFNANKYRIHANGSKQNGTPTGITLSGWLDGELLSLGLWLFLQGLSGRIPGPCPENGTPKKHLIQMADHRVGSNLGMSVSLTAPSYPTSRLVELDDPECALQGDTAALCLLLLKKAVKLNGGTLHVTREGAINIKIPEVLTLEQSIEATEAAISRITAELPTSTEPYEHYKPHIHNLAHGFVEAIIQELQHLITEAKHDETLIANQKFLNTVLRNCTYARLLLENLRWLGLGSELPPEAVDVAEAVSLIQQVLHGKIRNRPEDAAEGIAVVQQDIPSDLPPICANRMAVQQILLNLVMNGLEAMPQGGILTFKASVIEAEVCLEITDSGSGISPQNKDSIFDIAFTTKKGKQYGTGLYIVKAVIDRLGGRIEVESTPEVGSTFRLYFPAVSP